MNKYLMVSAGLNVVLVAVCLVLADRSSGAGETDLGGAPRAVVSEAVEVKKPVAMEPAVVEPQVEPNGGRKRPNLRGRDHKAQVAALVAEGWPEEDAKFYALGRVMSESIRNFAHLNQNRKYWESYQPPEMDWENQRKAMEEHFRVQEVMKDLLGNEMPGMYGGIGDLPFSPEKTRAAMMVQMDYQMMQMKLHHDAGGIMLPEDIEAQLLLEEERRRDLAAVLTPEELFEFEVRTSSVGSSLRHQLGAMEPTEEEFREIFRWKQEMEKFEYPAPGTVIDETAQQRRAETETAMKAALTEAFGEERYKEYERSQDWGYGRLKSVVKRLGLPEERAGAVFDAKEFLEERQQQIRQDGDLSPEEREAALQALSAETRAGLTELLGEEGLRLYEEQGGGHWLQTLRF